MGWQDVGVIAAMVGVIGGFVLTWRGQQQDKQLSEAAASRSEAAARLTADNTERVLLALETISAKDFGGTAVLATPRVKWSLTKSSGDLYIVTNVGDDTAYDVSVKPIHTSLWISEPRGESVLHPGDVVSFHAVVSLATADMTVEVAWTDLDSGDRRLWRYPLPV